MRISDWSSDVCSSDLHGEGHDTDRQHDQSEGKAYQVPDNDHRPTCRCGEKLIKECGKGIGEYDPCVRLHRPQCGGIDGPGCDAPQHIDDDLHCGQPSYRGHVRAGELQEDMEIGSASCRERECQNV